jgi:hypothetical protein
MVNTTHCQLSSWVVQWQLSSHIRGAITVKISTTGLSVSIALATLTGTSVSMMFQYAWDSVCQTVGQLVRHTAMAMASYIWMVLYQYSAPNSQAQAIARGKHDNLVEARTRTLTLHKKQIIVVRGLRKQCLDAHRAGLICESETVSRIDILCSSDMFIFVASNTSRRRALVISFVCSMRNPTTRI